MSNDIIKHFAPKVPVLGSGKLDFVPAGTPGALPGRVTGDVIAVSGTDRHPIVRYTGDPADTTAGTVLQVTTGEAEMLHAADLPVDITDESADSAELPARFDFRNRPARRAGRDRWRSFAECAVSR